MTILKAPFLVALLACTALPVHSEPNQTTDANDSNMREMSDESLAQLEAKAGITIDMAYELKIGEVVWLDSDTGYDFEEPNKTVVRPPERYLPPVILND